MTELKKLKEVVEYRAETKTEAVDFVTKKIRENENSGMRSGDISFKVDHKPAKKVKEEIIPEWFKLTITYVYFKE